MLVQVPSDHPTCGSGLRMIAANTKFRLTDVWGFRLTNYHGGKTCDLCLSGYQVTNVAASSIARPSALESKGNRDAMRPVRMSVSKQAI